MLLGETADKFHWVIRLHVCIFIRVYIRVSVYPFIRVCMHVDTCVYGRMYFRVCIRVCMQIDDMETMHASHSEFGVTRLGSMAL